jgi:hypothetical protein
MSTARLLFETSISVSISMICLHRSTHMPACLDRFKREAKKRISDEDVLLNNKLL